MHLLLLAPGGYSEDELYEVYISETNAVYRIKDQRLTPVEEFHGKVLKFEMLRSKEVIVGQELIT